MTSQKPNPTNPDDLFANETFGLSEVASPEVIRLHDGDSFAFHIQSVSMRFDDSMVRMLAYNGSIPGPILHVDQGSQITIHVKNEGDVETTMHWHGLRLENRYDGAPNETQAPIPIGGTFTYKLQFPDPGIYWYHPHIREDFAMEKGLYGPIVVEPADPSYWPASDRQMTITLDDLLVEDGQIVPFVKSGPTFTAMGRFGNIMLINGRTEFSGEAALGEVVRLYLVNTANTRIFNFAVRGARMKLVGGDSGRYERETFVDEVLLSPSERAVVDVLFDSPGDVRLEHRTPGHVYDLGAFSVTATAVSGASRSFELLRVDPELTAERQLIEHDLERSPDKVLAFVAEMHLHGDDDMAVTSYVCPMHPDVTATEPGNCPKCGMKLLPSAAPLVPTPELHEGAAHNAHEQGDGIEWEDLMPEINRASDPSNVRWKLIDRQTGAENGVISWAFRVGERVKIRLVNEMKSDHPMHHPLHIHGAGRFLILSRDGVPEPNLVWKDTVLVRMGETADILLEVTNPGLWMVHCHIAEHSESGMMFSFLVSEKEQPSSPGTAYNGGHHEHRMA